MKVENPESEESFVPDKPAAVPPQLVDDKIWEERMAASLANLTKRLEEKFEEDKNLALKALSQQVCCHLLEVVYCTVFLRLV